MRMALQGGKHQRSLSYFEPLQFPQSIGTTFTVLSVRHHEVELVVGRFLDHAPNDWIPYRAEFYASGNIQSQGNQCQCPV